MPSTASLTLNDYDGQPGIIGGNVPEISDTNYVAVATAMGTFRTAVEAVTLGLPIKSELSVVARFNGAQERATSNLAQRGNKWTVFYEDNTQWLDAPANTIPNPGYRRSFTTDIPTANLTFRTANQDIVWSPATVGDIPEMDNLAVAFQDLFRTPYSGVPRVNRIEASTRSGG